tara:strand:+ start:234 stop:539 length:306 start_codon:yes stop_codon:yes gene_type:complete
MPALEFASSVIATVSCTNRKHTCCIAFHSPTDQLVPVYFDRGGTPHTDRSGARLRERRGALVFDVHKKKYGPKDLVELKKVFPATMELMKPRLKLLLREFR